MGFETGLNGFYDLYASDNVLSIVILRLEDIVLYLYLRQYRYRELATEIAERYRWDLDSCERSRGRTSLLLWWRH